MKKIIVLLFCSIPFLVFSQRETRVVPGYLGKRLEFDYRFATFPVLKHLGEDVEFIDGNYPHGIEFFMKHQFMIDYAVGRKVSMGISYAFSRSHVYFSDDVTINGNSLPVYRPYKPIFSHYAGINIRFFQKNFFAPVGIYHQVEVGQITYGLADDTLHLYGYSIRQMQNRNDTVLVRADIKNKYASKYIRYGLNISSAVSRRIMLNAGISVGYIFGGDAYIKGETSMTADRFVPSTLSHYLRWEQVFNYHLGIGVLIF